MTDLTQEAKYLMNNEAFSQSLENCRQQAMTAALACDVKDDEGRRRYLDAIRTVDKVRAHLTALAMVPEEPTNVADFYEERAKSFLSKVLGK